MFSPITTILLVMAVTVAAVEGSVAFALIPFVLALLNEAAIAWVKARALSGDQ